MADDIAKPPAEPDGTWSDRVTDAVLRAMIWTMRRLPWAMRVRAMGWMTRTVIGRLAGYRRRAEQNLAYVWPEMGPAERRRIAARACDNAGRTLIENYSHEELAQRVRDLDPQGPGLAAIEEARKAGRPILLVTGHIGNHEVPRHVLAARGIEVGGLYKAMRNPFFNAHYVQTLEQVSGPVFERGRRGTMGFTRHLKAGGALVLLFDVFDHQGELIDFLGKPAPTSFSAADLALRFDALLVPFFGIRGEDGLSFDVHFEAPVPHGDRRAMMRELTDRLEARILEHPEQWFWIHRRWKPGIVARKWGAEAVADM